MGAGAAGRGCVVDSGRPPPRPAPAAVQADSSHTSMPTGARSAWVAGGALGCVVGCLAVGYVLANAGCRAAPRPGTEPAAQRTGLLAYDRWDAGQPRLAVGDLGAGTEFVVDNMTTLGDMEWAPDGRRVAVAGNEPHSDGTHVYIVEVDGGKVRRADSALHGRSTYQPAWSPDGNWLALTTGRDELCVIPQREGAPIVVAPRGTDYRWWFPAGYAWSPDSERLAFARTSRSNGNIDRFEIGVLDVATGDVDTIQDGPGKARMSSRAWSADGRRLAFSRWDEGGRSGVRVIAASPESHDLGHIEITIEDAKGAQFSPVDARRLLYGAAEGDAYRATVMDIGGGVVLRLSPPATEVKNVNWTPSGDGLLYIRRGPDRLEDVWLEGPGTKPCRLTTHGKAAFSPQLAPTNRRQAP